MKKLLLVVFTLLPLVLATIHGNSGHKQTPHNPTTSLTTEIDPRNDKSAPRELEASTAYFHTAHAGSPSGVHRLFFEERDSYLTGPPKSFFGASREIVFDRAGMSERRAGDPDSSSAATVSFISSPAVLPRNTPAGNYSPLVSLEYGGLERETYTLQVHLLETDQPTPFLCGCDENTQMWCPASFTLDNQNGLNSSGRIFDARITNVNNYQNFLWVADLINQGGLVVSSATSAASSSLNRAPVLAPIGNKTVALGQSLDLTVSASDLEGDAVNLSAVNLPAGATFNNATGQFHWQPSSTGTYSLIGFIATQAGAIALSDAELISIQVTDAPSPTVLAFSMSSYTTGESGPAVLTVARSNSSLGTVTVAYSTVNGTAIAGSDFTGVSSATLTFAAGETAKTIRVPIANDSSVEANETFQVVLSDPGGGSTLGSPFQATVTIVDDDSPQLAGQWGSVIAWPMVPIHMHLLPSGKVMFWDRHDHHLGRMWDVTPRLWDPANPTMLTSLELPGWDIFCSGHTLLADGRLLVGGGHIADFVGAATAGIYNPFTNSWTPLPNMNAGRWYPTTAVLNNGEVLVLAGTKLGYTDINPLPQVWQINTNTWRNLSGAMLGPYPAWPDYYPYAFVALNGKIFVAGPQKTARYLDTTGTGAWTDVANSSLCYRDYGSSVMYNDNKVLIVGGNPRDDCSPDIPLPIFPSATAEVINLNDSIPAWRSVPPMSVGRRHLNTTILPDGKILVTGGSSNPGHDDPAGAVLYAELWNPDTETWTLLAAHTRYRGYHSGGLLLPDARVLVAGGGHPDPLGGTAETNGEIYSPPYLFKGVRPVITSAPPVVTYGQTFSVQTPDATNIANVNWIRLSSVTHGFNESQRINRLAFSKTSNNLNVTAPTNGNLCPPGHYMLFILNSNGVPSVAKIIQVVDSAVQFSLSSIIVNESSPRVDIAVTRSGDISSNASVSFRTNDSAGLTNCNVLNGAASPRCDYINTLGTISFAAGQSSRSFSVAIIDDSYAEGSETFTIGLTSSSGATLDTQPTATITITDNETTNGPNPIDNTNFFVRQQYLDFLGREPDPPGFVGWVNTINNCTGDTTQCDRIHVSQLFFQSAEFQQRGYYVYRFYPVAFGRKPDYDEFVPALASVSGFLDDNQLEAAKVAFFAESMARPAFGDIYGPLNNAQYVDMLLTTAGVTLSSRQSMIDGLNNSTLTRAVVLRQIVESPEVSTKYNHQAYAVMEYFGYLRRQPDAFYLDWIQVLDQTNDPGGMVTGFVNSVEYRQRFGP